MDTELPTFPAADFVTGFVVVACTRPFFFFGADPLFANAILLIVPRLSTFRNKY